MRPGATAANRDHPLARVRSVVPVESLRLDATAFFVATCGALSHLSVKMIGEIPAGEALLLLVATVMFLIRGIGPYFSPRFFWTMFASGMLMIVGYLVSDLVSVTGPAQYLRGWARVFMMVADCIAVQIVVSHGRRYLWWFVVAFAASLLFTNLANGTPLTVAEWKSGGYGFAVGLLLAVVCGYLPRLAAGVVLCGFGLLSVMLDFRSVGGVFLFCGVLFAVRAMSGGRSRFPVLRVSAMIIVIAVAVGALALALVGSDDEYLERRLESNSGRYVGLMIATRAIVDSPLIGYGSWAADPRYTKMLRQEAARASAHTRRPVEVGHSMMPHSQVLQAWVEGGVLGALFFLIYGAAILRSVLWVAHRHEPGRMTPLLLIILVLGAWNLVASPFLGAHRILIMLAIAAIALISAERRHSRAGLRRAGWSPIPAGSVHPRSPPVRSPS
jgi:O-antigen ligase